MVRHFLLIIILAFLAGCTHSRQFSNYDQLNSILEDKIVKLEMKDGSRLRVENLQISPDSTSWQEPKTGSKRLATGTEKVHKILIIDRGKGAAEGLGFFMAVGFGLGIAGFLDGDDPPGFFSFRAEEKFMVGFLAGGIIPGVVLGIPIGAFNGSTDIYVLNPKSPKK
ncbi:MAG: hypothetical protein DWQ05_05120 [Calditrichaeota bacterium]|nr:MAG: hypothetical protein DWQ05_05120 [Calditrichota bacterium]